MFRTSTSAIKSFQSDPFQWYVEYILGRTVRYPPAALVAGIAWHIFMEDILNGIARPVAKAALATALDIEVQLSNDAGLFERAKGIAKEKDILLIAADLWQDKFDVKTLAVEKGLRLNLTCDNGKEFEIVGRPDRVVEFGGRIGHYQHRTLASTKPVVPYLRVFFRNPHEGTYWQMLANEYDTVPFGTILSLVRKFAPTKMLEKPDVAIQQHLIPITQEQATWTVDNVRASVQAMIAVAQGEIPLWFNTDRDLGQYGNSLSPFVRAFIDFGMDGFKDDTWFKDTEDRYTDLAESA